MNPDQPPTWRDHLTGAGLAAALFTLPGLINLIPLP